MRERPPWRRRADRPRSRSEGEVTVAIPVRDGGELLVRTLRALARQTVAHELLVCDSGSRDGSVALARAHGARVVEIEPQKFGHGATRNLLVSEARGERVALLTQDAEPADERWLACLLGGFELAQDVGIVYGPYRPRPQASPAVRRELEGWFGSLSPDGQPRVERRRAGARARLGAGRTAWLLHRRQRLHRARRLGARALPRGRLRRGPPAGARHAAGGLRQGVRAARRRAALPRLHRARAAAPQLRRVAGPARGVRLARAREPAPAGRPTTRGGGDDAAGAARRGRRYAAPRRDARDGGRSPYCAPRGGPARLARGQAPSGAAPAALAGAPGELPAARPRSTLLTIDPGQPHVTDDAEPPQHPPTARSSTTDGAALEARFRGPRAGLRRRVYLTYRYLGWRTLLFRALTLPLRL